MARTTFILLLAVLVVATTLSVAHAQAEWLAAHNAARSAVGVSPLAWNVTLAAYALNWAQTEAAKPGCPMEHSNGPDGENIARNVPTAAPTMIVRDQWVAEKANYTYKTNSCVEGQMCGHYTQVVWNTTITVGCTSAKLTNCVKAANTFFICSYHPPGNYIGEWPY